MADNELSWGNVKFGDLVKNWPKDENGEPEEPAFLKHCSCVDMDDELTVSLLEGFGIPSLRQYGGSAKVVLGMSAMGADIYVPESLLPDARALLESGTESTGGAREDEEL